MCDILIMGKVFKETSKEVSFQLKIHSELPIKKCRRRH